MLIWYFKNKQSDIGLHMKIFPNIESVVYKKCENGLSSMICWNRTGLDKYLKSLGMNIK